MKTVKVRSFTRRYRGHTVRVKPHKRTYHARRKA